MNLINMDKIVLGTAQFGMDYGINNKRGKIPLSEAYKILNLAIESKIDTLDTAVSYGESEEVLGKLMKGSVYEWKIISKLPECKNSQVEAIVDTSLKKLNITKLYGCLIHSFDSYKRDMRIWDGLERLKADSKITKIGFSLYYPKELEFILQKNIRIDLVQLPFNIFDQRFLSYLPQLKEKGIELYARSVFLQGLVFKDPKELGGYFDPIRKKIEELKYLSMESEIPIFALCLNFVLMTNDIDKVVAGVDNLLNLREIVSVLDFSSRLNSAIFGQLSDFRIDDENIILPFKWKTEALAH